MRKLQSQNGILKELEESKRVVCAECKKTTEEAHVLHQKIRKVANRWLCPSCDAATHAIGKKKRWDAGVIWEGKERVPDR